MYEQVLLSVLTSDYFCVGALTTVCVRMVERNLRVKNAGDVVAFAIEHQFDSLLESSVYFMEEYSHAIVNCGILSKPKPYPLPAVIEFLSSPDLEVREFDLFNEIEQWYNEQKHVLSADNIKSVFSLIRYPLIAKDCLMDTVHPTNLAVPDLYKAALEYHDTGSYDGPQKQITVKKFYFDFDPVEGLTIDHTPKGTLITKSQSPVEICTCFASIDNHHAWFLFCLKSCTDKSKIAIHLLNIDNTLDCDTKVVYDIPIGEEFYGGYLLKMVSCVFTSRIV